MKTPLFERRPCLVLFGLILFLSRGYLAQAEVVTREIAPGITFTQEVAIGMDALQIHILKIDLNAPGVKVRCGQAQETISLSGPTKGRESIERMARRKGALAAVNADFFPYTGDPLGLAIRDGELLSEPMEYRACMGIGPKGILMDVLVPVGTLTLGNGQAVALDGINRVPQDGELVALTPSYTATPKIEKACVVLTLSDVSLPVRVSTAIRGTAKLFTMVGPGEPLPAVPDGGTLLVGVGKMADVLANGGKLGNSFTFRFDLMPNSPAPVRGRFPSRRGSVRGAALMPSWTEVEQAVGGGPWLVRNGEVAVDGEAEGFPKVEFVEKRHPRTAAGVMMDGKLLLVAVDGRQAWSRGASLTEMAEIMKRLGAVNAINLDGGGSTTMVIAGSVVNAPSDGRTRPVADGLLIYGTPNVVAISGAVQIRPNVAEGVMVRVGEKIAFSITDAEGKTLAADVPILWGTDDGFGFISQKGVFSSYRAGTGTVTAWVGGQRLTVPVKVIGMASPAAPLKVIGMASPAAPRP